MKATQENRSPNLTESTTLNSTQISEFTEGLPVGLILIDKMGHIISANAQALEIFDFNRRDIVLAGESGSPTSFISLLAESEQLFWQNLLLVVSGTGEDHCNFRHFHQTRYDQKILSLKITRMPNLNDGDILAIATWDVTAQVTKEKYIILSEKLVARGEMAASIADSLNSHLDALDDKAKLILSNLDQGKTDGVRFNSEAMAEYIGTIRDYIEQSLNYSTPHTAFILYDIRDLIEDLLMSLKLKPRFKDINFTINLAADMPAIEMDVAQIQYVIKNLLNNSADTLNEKKERLEKEQTRFENIITIETRWDLARETASIIVEDNGEGIPPETVTKIFNLHFSTKKTSRGMGLYQCKQIVEQHDGKLTPESTPGEGSTFTLELPRLMKD